jgi:hypothetical protein
VGCSPMGCQPMSPPLGLLPRSHLFSPSLRMPVTLCLPPTQGCFTCSWGEGGEGRLSLPFLWEGAGLPCPLNP